MKTENKNMLVVAGIMLVLFTIAEINILNTVSEKHREMNDRHVYELELRDKSLVDHTKDDAVVIDADSWSRLRREGNICTGDTVYALPLSEVNRRITKRYIQRIQEEN